MGGRSEGQDERGRKDDGLTNESTCLSRWHQSDGAFPEEMQEIPASFDSVISGPMRLSYLRLL